MLPSPPPLLPPPSADQADLQGQQLHYTRNSGLSLSILIIACIIAFVVAASASIHFLLRHIRRRRHVVPDSSPSPAAVAASSSSSLHSPSISFRAESNNNATAHPTTSQKALIDSLPLFTLSSAVTAPLKSSPDCAVCLSRFEPDEQLRLLPSCRHAFHSTCVDTWLRSTPSCPLCRAPIGRQSPCPAAAPNPAAIQPAPDRSGSFRVEIGSVSQRRDGDDARSAAAPAPPPHARTYSIGSSFEYVVEDEIEAVVASVAAHLRRNSSTEQPKVDAGSAVPGDRVAEAAGGGGSGRGWLREYVDRLASSASSSFSSMRCSGRWSRRSDGGGAVSSGVFVGGGGSWDLEAHYLGRAGEELEPPPYYSFYKWLVGA